jgi:hypothetical protein
MNLQNKIAKIINIRDESTYPKISELKVADAILQVISEALPKEKHPKVTSYYPSLGELRIDFHIFDKEIGYNQALQDIRRILGGK